MSKKTGPESGILRDTRGLSSEEDWQVTRTKNIEKFAGFIQTALSQANGLELGLIALEGLYTNYFERTSGDKERENWKLGLEAFFESKNNGELVKEKIKVYIPFADYEVVEMNDGQAIKKHKIFYLRFLYEGNVWSVGIKELSKTKEKRTFFIVHPEASNNA